MAEEDVPDFDSHESDEKLKLNKKEEVDVGNLSGWNEMSLKDDLKRAIRENGF